MKIKEFVKHYVSILQEIEIRNLAHPMSECLYRGLASSFVERLELSENNVRKLRLPFDDFVVAYVFCDEFNHNVLIIQAVSPSQLEKEGNGSHLRRYVHEWN